MGKFYGFGFNRYNTLLHTTPTWNQATPIFVTDDYEKVKSAYNGYVVFGLKSDGSLYVWGDSWDAPNPHNKKPSESLSPTEVSGGTTWIDMGGGQETAWLVRSDGNIYVYGDNSTGGLGLGYMGAPYIVDLTYFGNTSEWKTIDLSQGQSFGLKQNGTIWRWAYYDSQGTPPPPPTPTPTQIGSDSDWVFIGGVQSIGNNQTSGLYSIYAIKSNGTLHGINYGFSSITQIGSATNWVKVFPTIGKIYILNNLDELYLLTTTNPTTPALIFENVNEVSPEIWNDKIAITDNNDLLYGFSKGVGGLSLVENYYNVSKLDVKLSLVLYEGIEIRDPYVPTGLTATDIGGTNFKLNWVNNETEYIDGNAIQIYSGSTWVTIATVSSGSTSLTIYGLSPLTTYQFKVSVIFNTLYFSSESIEVTTTDLPLLKSFCETADYTVSGSTCGLSGGSVTINNTDYLGLFDFTLKDVEGNSYIHSDGVFTGLTSNYYFLTATPKQEFWQYYGKQPCTFEWIKIEDTDTSLSLTQKYIEPAMCQGFGRQRGRIGFVFEDAENAPDYVLKVYNLNTEKVYEETLSGLTNPFIFYATPQCYYAVLTNGNGCSYFVDSTCVQSIDAMTVEGIDKLYLTKYDTDLVINYWGLEDEEYYIGGYDSNFYTSTKIKEILNTDVWYEIPLVSADASYSQKLVRGSNGITYEESIDVVVHHKDIQKWIDMITLLNDRYIIVFKDNNGYYWTFGYGSGTEIREYKLEDNAYKFKFIQPAVTKLLAGISEDYVNTYIK